MSWLDNAAKNLLPLSRDQQNFALALREWHYTGNFHDLEVAIENCGLCEHPEIRYQFEIANQYTGNTLLVGSECIHKFEIGAIDDSGALLDAEDSRRKVDKDRRALIAEARRRRVINTLVRLAGLDKDFKITSFIDYYQERGAFTPNQLAMLVWRLNEHRVPYNPADFSMIIRRGREKDQLIAMAEWKVRRIWRCMSAPQRRFYVEETGIEPNGTST